MPKPLRFTGRNPPPELWSRYPNWRNALEEEGEEGQDESMLMPHEVQAYIAPHTSFTAGRVRLHDSREFPAFLAVLGDTIIGCQVYETGAPWRIYYSSPAKSWVSFRAEWLPEAKRPPHVSFQNAAVFPVEIYMQVPWKEGGRPAVYQISADGQMSEMSPS